MSPASKPLDVFRDLHLRGPATASAALHQALKEHAVTPWRYAAEKEPQLRAMGQKDAALAFDRSATPGFDAAGLVLIAASDGMEVANIVPRETGELSHRAYNAILEDFATRIAQPAARAVGFRVELSSSTLQLEDEMPPVVAEALRRFSALANKSTRAAHPRDRDRWFDFIILAHRSSARLDASMLARWLCESEDWPENGAQDLAGEYERSRALLARFSTSA
jgi:hypothetical protein